MADKKISELTALTSPDGAEELVVNDGGTSKKITQANLFKLGDNVKAQFGDSQDLQIYHDGVSTSYIKASSDLFLQGTDDVVIRDASTLEEHIRCNLNDSVQIGHNGSFKLATTSTGIDVTGTVTADGLQTDTANTNTNLIARNSSNASTYIQNGGTGDVLHARSGSMLAGQGDLHFQIANNGDISFYEDTGTTPKFRWDASTERLGIGTSSPARGLQIHKEGNHLSLTTTASGTAAGNGSDFKVDASSSDLQILNYEASNTTLWTNGYERLCIDSSGRVGIGTSSPTSILNLHNSTASDGDGARETKLTFSGRKASGTVKRTGSIKGVHDGTGNDGLGRLEFEPGEAGTKMTLDSSGNVGIGTSSPDGTLHLDAGTSSDLVIEKDSAGGAAVRFHNAGSQVSYIQLDASEDMIHYGGSGVNQIIYAGGYERLRIDSSGNVGIGVTPESAWRSTFDVMQIGSGSSVSGENTGTSTWYGSNAYNDGTNWKYINSSYASLYGQTSDGKHQFQVETSGTADSAISWTTAMTIDNSGRTLIGRTTTVGYKLDVLGDALFERTGTSATHIVIKNANGNVGTITSSGTSTSYNTSSDYRLKENLVPMTGSIDRLKQLLPSRFNFIADPDTTVDGFLAHEAGEVVPEAITGTKDGMMTEEYEVSPALGSVYTPAIEEVSETVIVTPAIEAQDAVMGERQVTETVEGITYVNLAGETITETSEVGVTEEATETVVERQEIDGVLTEVEVEHTVQVPVMEAYEVSPAISAEDEVTETTVTTEAVAEVIIESGVEKPEQLEDGQQWRETTPAVMAEREVEDYQGIDQGKLVPLLVSALQEAVARIEQLENA